MKKIYLFTSLILTILLLSGEVAKAQRTASVTGNWSNTATWGGAPVPISSDAVTINSGVIVTVDVAAVCASITINAPAANNGITISGTNILTVGGAITMNAPSAGTITSTVSVGTGTLNAASIAIPGSSTSGRYCTVSLSTGTINVTGNITFSGTAAQARLMFTDAGTLNIGGTLGTGGTFTASTGTVNYNAATLNILPTTYYNLTFSTTGTKTVSGNLTISGTFSGGSSTLSIGANLTLSIATTSGNSCGTISFAGGFTLTYAGVGTLSCSSINMGQANSKINFSGEGTLNCSGNVSLGSSSGQQLTCGSGHFNLTGNFLNGGSGITISCTSGSINCGSITLTSGATISCGTGTFTCTGISIAAGTISCAAGGIFTTGSGDISFTSTPCNVTANGTITCHNLTFTSSAVLTVGGTGNMTCNNLYYTSANTLTFTGAGILNIGGVLTIVTPPLTFTPSTGTVNFNGADQSVPAFSNPFYNLTLSGTGTKILAAATNMTGTLTVNAGVTLNLSTFTLGSPTNTVLYCGATIGSTISGSATLTLGGPVTAISAGTGTIGATITCPVSLGTTTRTFAVADDGTVATDLTISGAISGSSGGSITKTGPGTMQLSGNNLYSGITTISEGTLQPGAGSWGTGSPLGNTTGVTIVSTGATLNLNGITLPLAEPLTLNGSGISSGGALMNSGAAATYSGLITLGSASSIVGSTGSINISNTGTITGSGFGLILGGAQGGTLSSILGTGSGSLTKEGTGTWTLMGASTYTGSTIINAGILQLGTADRISNSSNMVLNGGTFSTGAAAGYTETIGKLTLSNNSIIALGPGPHTLTFADSHGETWTGTLTITGWTGTLGTSGSEGKISFSSSGGLLETQLAKIKFLISGSFYTAAMLSTGEVVPSTNLVAGYWLGTISSAWENTGNWNGGSSTSSPVIPSLGVVNNPTISWFVNITSLENQSGRTLTVGTGGALVASTVTNSGTIAISPTGKATINGLTNNGALNLNSDATGIASLIFDSYSGNGTANVQLYLTGGGGPMYKWHYITVPFTTGLSKSFFTDLNGDGTLDNNNLQAYDEFRVNTSTIQGWLWHNGEAHGVLAAGTAFSSLNYGKGYNFYHSSASRTITLSAASPLGTSLSIAYLDFTSSSDATLHGYNLLGNSLTCSIDWDYVIFGENVGHTVYFTTDNQWVSYLSGPGGANGATHYIPPLQGFFVKAEADNAEINFTSSYIRAHQSSQLRYKKSENDQAETKEEIVYPKVKLELSGTSTSDETIVWFNNEATTGYDLKYDGYKLFSSGDALGQFYSTLGGVNYVFNGLPLPTDSTIVPLGVKIAQAGNYSILKKVLEKLDNYNVYLIDKTNGNYTVDLKKADKYNFISDAGTFDNRFVLNFVSLTTSAEAPSVVSKNFNIYSTKSFINILPPDDFAGGSDGSVRIYDLTGRIIKQFKNLGLYEGTLVQIPFTGRQGIYIVEITSGISRYKGKVSVR